MIPSGVVLGGRDHLKSPVYGRSVNSESCIKIKLNSIFNFHISFWCLKKFYEGL